MQNALREVFTRWGRPERLRVDNGTPWGSKGDWPTDLALWLIGMDIVMIWNPARQPQDNGVVERSQGTGKRWAEPRACPDAAELQGRLDKMDRIQREDYPSRSESRWQTFPGLQAAARPYSRAWEKRHWDMEKILAHMADYTALRRVDSKGQVSIYGRNHYVGKSLHGQDIYVSLDPIDREWIFSTIQGVQLRHKVADEITRDRILKLQVTNRRDVATGSCGKTQCRY